jgi:uncharacterized membrane protein YqjE
VVANLLRLTGFGYATAAFTRLSRVISRLVRRQIERSSEELAKDIRRVLIGSVFIGLAFVFALLSLITFHVLVGLLLNEHLSNISTISILLGFDLVMSVVLFGVAFLLLRKPFLRQTRKEVVDLFEIITEG